MKLLLKILTLFVAIGAIGGAVMMWMDPSNIFFVLGLVEVIAAMIFIRRH